MTVKAYLKSDEWYPVYTAGRTRTWSGEIEVEIDEQLMARIERVFQEFREIQHLLSDLEDKGTSQR